MPQTKEEPNEIEQLKAQLAEQAAQLQEYEKRDEGWLIWTPNPAYEGVVYGVRFHEGQAFVPLSAQFPRYSSEEMKPGTLEKLLAQVPEEKREAERAAILERHNRPTSEIVVGLIQADFGYQVRYFTIEQRSQRLQLMEQRSQEAATERARLEELGKSKELVQPQYLG